MSSCSKRLKLPEFQTPQFSWLTSTFWGTRMISRPFRWIQLPETRTPLIRHFCLIP